MPLSDKPPPMIPPEYLARGRGRREGERTLLRVYAKTVCGVDLEAAEKEELEQLREKTRGRVIDHTPAETFVLRRRRER